MVRELVPFVGLVFLFEHWSQSCCLLLLTRVVPVVPVRGVPVVAQSCADRSSSSTFNFELTPRVCDYFSALFLSSSLSLSPTREGGRELRMRRLSRVYLPLLTREFLGLQFVRFLHSSTLFLIVCVSVLPFFLCFFPEHACVFLVCCCCCWPGHKNSRRRRTRLTRPFRTTYIRYVGLGAMVLLHAGSRLLL